MTDITGHPNLASLPAARVTSFKVVNIIILLWVVTPVHAESGQKNKEVTVMSDGIFMTVYVCFMAY